MRVGDPSMQLESRKRLQDAQDAGDAIAGFVAEIAFDQYRANRMLRSAVERQFEIVGEALRQLDRTDPETAGRIPELGRIVAFRNILIHGYASVDDRVVWGIIEGNLTALRDAIRALLASP